MTLRFFSFFFFFLSLSSLTCGYPVDGYSNTGIRRLERLRLIINNELAGPKPVPGSRYSSSFIKLNLLSQADLSVSKLTPDPVLQKKIEALVLKRDPSYTLAVLDITPGQSLRYAVIRPELHFSPGSVGKLAIAAGLFTELKRLYPNDIQKRKKILKDRKIIAEFWIHKDHHPVPVFNPATREFISRPIQEGDVFSLYEWADHMLSASANSAGSTLWKELILMRAFESQYPPSREEEALFFKKTPKHKLQSIALSVVNDPLREMGIPEKAWRLGTFFTKGGQNRVPGIKSYGSIEGFMEYLIRLEQGKIADEWSSLELKKLLYMTARRIRYASSPKLEKAAVYFKSGSLFRCKSEPGFQCKKYHGNIENVMNSVAIVEHPNGKTYLTVLLSNVLRKNSAFDHQSLASHIDAIITRDSRL